MTPESKNLADQRRSQRVLLRVPIQVRWQPPGEETIVEDTATLVVNAHGALISLAMKVKAGQKIILRNWSMPHEKECRVVHVRESLLPKKEVGVAFLHPDASFWGVEFPPEDWKPYVS
jgi:hypothetical protein